MYRDILGFPKFSNQKFYFSKVIYFDDLYRSIFGNTQT